jgi:hypothetical protein
MIAAGSDFCIAVHRFGFNSQGTKDCARRAAKAGIPTYLVGKVVSERRLASYPATVMDGRRYGRSAARTSRGWYWSANWPRWFGR